MKNISNLRRHYELETRGLVHDPLPRFRDDGLRLGRGTLLARRSSDHSNGGFGLETNRLTVLLATAYREVQPLALKHARRAFDHWRHGDMALAQIELAFARLPRLDREEDAFRLFLAGTLLDEGLAPHELARELGLDLQKYDPHQPRVPAGSGRESGRWGSQSGPSADARTGLGVRFFTEAASDAASETAGRSFLADASPGIVRALAAFAARFSTPTAVLGALFIPTPNSGGVTRGTLPDAPDVGYERDGPAGILRLTQKGDDGTEALVVAQNRGGIFVDVATGEALGRDFGEQIYLDLETVEAALAPRERPKAAGTDDGPRLCPAPTRDVPHGAKDHVLDYEDDVHRRVNPLAPIPRGFAVQIVDPATGNVQHPDDCFRDAGDLIDHDMKPGDFADAKGEEIEHLLSLPGVGQQVMAKIIEATERHLRAAKARGANLKLYFAEKGAADIVRAYLAKDSVLQDVKVAYLPPSKPKTKARVR